MTPAYTTSDSKAYDEEDPQMADGNTSFFSDPKVVVSILAIVVSIVSLVWTLANQFDQNRRWDVLNAAAVEFTEGRFFVWREMTKEEAFATKWGYEPLILGSEQGWNRFRLVYFVQLRDPTTGAVLPHSNPVFTVSEADSEARRVGATPPVALYRAFRPVFYFQNIGKTEARDCSVQISINTGDNTFEPAFTSNTPFRIAAGQKVNVSFDFALPLARQVPDTIRFEIHLKFTDVHEKLSERDVTAGWESKRDYWFYAPTKRS